jgi:hypothetical protein
MNTINKGVHIKFCIVGLVLVLLMLCPPAETQQSEATAQTVAYCDRLRHDPRFVDLLRQMGLSSTYS